MPRRKPAQHRRAPAISCSAVSLASAAELAAQVRYSSSPIG
jgi:hypothetical protein